VIVIPMGGASSRFFAAGWNRPKYELPVGSRPLFDLCVGSFAAYIATERFLFVVRAEYGAERFVDEACARLAIQRAEVVALNAPTRGQAETVKLGLERAGVAGDEPVTVFNVDTVRPAFAHPPQLTAWDGYLEVFEGAGDHWSFVEPAGDGSTRVRRTAEKLRISSLCSTGLYYFARARDFTQAFERAAADPGFMARWRELYVAPLYNFLIERGLDIRYRLIEPSAVIFAGTPAEYLELRAAHAAPAGASAAGG
jgi:hypothetical protein